MTRRALALGALLAALAFGCTEKRTQVMVVLEADPGIRQDAAKLRLLVYGGRSQSELLTEVVHERSPDYSFAGTTPEIDWPVEIALIPRDDDVGRRFRVEATALDESDQPLAIVRAISGYLEEKTLLLRLRFEDSCRGVLTCMPTETCRAGSCMPADIPASRLPVYGADAGSGDGGATRDGDVDDAGLDGGPDDGGFDGGPDDGGFDASDDGGFDGGPDDGGFDASDDGGFDGGPDDGGFDASDDGGSCPSGCPPTYGSWSACSGMCPTGMQSRSVTYRYCNSGACSFWYTDLDFQGCPISCPDGGIDDGGWDTDACIMTTPACFDLIDNDCDGSVDETPDECCGVDPDCADGDPCTDDYCMAGYCMNIWTCDDSGVTTDGGMMSAGG